MLKNIHPALNADVLYALRAMGHGDYLVVCDTNFPADSVSVSTVCGEVLRMENLTAAKAVDAILSVMPLDTFIEDAVKRMQMIDTPDQIPPVQQEVQQAIDSAQGRSVPLVPVERFQFYDTAKDAYAIIQTGERRFYGCFVLTKGVIGPDKQ